MKICYYKYIDQIYMYDKIKIMTSEMLTQVVALVMALTAFGRMLHTWFKTLRQKEPNS
jgi:hypothetical protein